MSLLSRIRGRTGNAPAETGETPAALGADSHPAGVSKIDLPTTTAKFEEDSRGSLDDGEGTLAVLEPATADEVLIAFEHGDIGARDVDHLDLVGEPDDDLDA